MGLMMYKEMLHNNGYLTIDGLYGHRSYHKPQRHEWMQWFAWYPVQTLTWKYIDDIGIYVKYSKWIWFEQILYRKVIDNLAGPGREFAGSSSYTEYISVIDLLKFG